MPGHLIYLNGELKMPNGAVLFAEDIGLDVEYHLDGSAPELAYSPSRDWDFDFSVERVLPITVFDDMGDAIRLELPPCHPAIVKLVNERAADIEDNCRTFGRF